MYLSQLLILRGINIDDRVYFVFKKANSDKISEWLHDCQDGR